MCHVMSDKEENLNHWETIVTGTEINAHMVLETTIHTEMLHTNLFHPILYILSYSIKQPACIEGIFTDFSLEPANRRFLCKSLLLFYKTCRTDSVLKIVLDPRELT